jgi:hypothetical protein
LSAIQLKKAQLELETLYEKATKVTRKFSSDYLATEEEKDLKFKAGQIQDEVYQAIKEAEDRADKISDAEGIQFPEAYQVLLDELTPLRKRKADRDRTRRIIIDIAYRKLAGEGSVMDIVKAFDTAIAKEPEERRISELEYQINNKRRSGSKVQRAGEAFWHRKQTLRSKAAYDTEVAIYKVNPDWKDIQDQYKSLLQTLKDRHAAEIASFKKPLRKALENLQQASILEQARLDRQTSILEQARAIGLTQANA